MDNNEITEENPVTVKRLSRFRPANILKIMRENMISLCLSALFALCAYGIYSLGSYILASGRLSDWRKIALCFVGLFTLFFAVLSISLFVFTLRFSYETPFKGEMKFKHENREYTLHLDFFKDRRGDYQIERCYIAFTNLVNKDINEKNEKIDIHLESIVLFKVCNGEVIRNTATFNDLKISNKFNWGDFTNKTALNQEILNNKIVEFCNSIKNSDVIKKELEKNNKPNNSLEKSNSNTQEHISSL